MNLLGIHTGKLLATDSLVEALTNTTTFNNNDIIAISSKVIAYLEGAAIDLTTLTPSDEAIQWSKQLTHAKKNPAFREAVLQETARMNGRVLNGCPMAMLCELRPEGLQQGVVLAVNAGLDLSNIDKNYAIGWPIDPVASAKQLQADLQAATGVTLGVVITDSCCHPRRWGVGAMALTVAGFNPLVNEIGRTDLWGDELNMTQEAVADQLSTATNFIMGNADQAIPAVIVRDHGLPLSDFCGWVPGVDPEQDLYQGIV